jgi:sugar/nucleoside kinase (ribokinase family)
MGGCGPRRRSCPSGPAASGPRCTCPARPRPCPPGDVDLDTIASADVRHVGGPDVVGRFGGEPLAGVLRFAREHGLITTADVLSRCDRVTWDRLQPALPYVQYFLPNEDQLAGLTGTKDLTEAARMVLALGPEAVLVSRAGDGAALVTAGRRVDVPAFPVQVVDTTGCGDAVTAGFIIGLLRGWPIEDASWLGMAAASLVAGGLGSDAGIVDYAGTVGVLRSNAPSQVRHRIGPG